MNMRKKAEMLPTDTDSLIYRMKLKICMKTSTNLAVFEISRCFIL